MIILGKLHPGTAALGYGIVERNGGRLRAIDYGCPATSPDSSLPGSGCSRSTGSWPT